MISFPIFHHLDVQGYGLYPGTQSAPGLEIEFRPGVTLILGANGLGKTTLVTVLFRMCTGPTDIPGLARGGELGTRNTQAAPMTRSARRLFAERVVDDAAEATASLRFTLGDTTIRVTRSLGDLSLTGLSASDKSVTVSEESFQQLVLQSSGLGTFGDWILLLRHLTFYFEDRRALVWDATAQRQILRLLFVPAAAANEWLTLEREILERDSRMRNLQSALSREEIAVRTAESSITESDAMQEDLALQQRLQQVDEPRRDALNDRVADLDSERQEARLATLQAELDHEHAYRNLERLQLRTIDSSFPTENDTARYLFAKLFAENECLACGSVASGAAAALGARLSHGECVVCGSHLDGQESTKRLAPRAITRAEASLEATEERLEAARKNQAAIEDEFSSLIGEVQALNAAIAHRAATIDSLVKRLPAADTDLLQQRRDLATLRGRVEVQKRELAEQRGAFAEFMETRNRSIVRRKKAIQAQFSDFASGFLLEDCALLWATQRTRVGESGQTIEFPAFELEMGGTNFPSRVRRTGPDQVSESQREFIDLAFRMTLMTVAGSNGAGSLVIDAPESSLDAVFVKRAADVLTRFGRHDSDNRLVVTSNLIEGDLIPELARKARIRSATDDRVVDLLKLAAPTTATRRLHKDYARVRKALFDRARSAG